MIVEDDFVDGDFECEFYTFIRFLPEGNLRSGGGGGGGGGWGGRGKGGKYVTLVMEPRFRVTLKPQS